MKPDKIMYAEEYQQFISSMRPIINKKALFSDTSENYVIPNEPEPFSKIRIRFRAAKDNVDHVFLVFNNQKEIMNIVETDDQFDYYEIEHELTDTRFDYYFLIKSGKLICFYDKRGVVKTAGTAFSFFILPGFSTPTWAKGAVMYQIYVDRFCNGDASNDVLSDEYNYIGAHTKRIEDWYQLPAVVGIHEFYGGDLQGVLDKMDYLESLGIDVIYFNPLFVSPSNHKYDIQDYDYIDPHVGKIVDDRGELLKPDQKDNLNASKYINRVSNKANLEASNELFIQVVREAHKRGIKVILDGVFNHCGSFNKWLDRERIYENVEGYPKGAFISEASPYHDYFQFLQNGWPYNTHYDGWWGHETLPKLNYEGSKQLYDYILHIGRKWVSEPYNCDGWRLDVAADLAHSPEENHRFWKDFRREVKTANPNAIILAEHYGNPEAWLQGDEWDTVMNYDAFMEPVTWFLTGMQKHSDDYREDLLGNAGNFWNSMTRNAACFSDSSLLVTMNQLSNHDHSRFLTRTNHKVGRVGTMGSKAAEEGVNFAVMREAIVMQMTWPGAPTLYYGDEAGVCGFTDPDNRRTYPWGRENQDLIAFTKAMIAIHKANPELITGSVKALIGDYNFIGYGRFTRTKQTIVLINNGNEEVTKVIKVDDLGIPREAMLSRLILTTENGFTQESNQYLVVSGNLKITLPKTSAIVIHHEKE